MGHQDLRQRRQRPVDHPRKCKPVLLTNPRVADVPVPRIRRSDLHRKIQPGRITVGSPRWTYVSLPSVSALTFEQYPFSSSICSFTYSIARPYDDPPDCGCVWKTSHPWIFTGRSGGSGIGGCPSFSSSSTYPSGVSLTLP